VVGVTFQEFLLSIVLLVANRSTRITVHFAVGCRLASAAVRVDAIDYVMAVAAEGVDRLERVFCGRL
jgi:hypothetical protein